MRPSKSRTSVNERVPTACSAVDDPANVSHFEEPEMVRVSHILLTTSDPKTSEPLSDAAKTAKHKQMEDLLKKARAGELEPRKYEPLDRGSWPDAVKVFSRGLDGDREVILYFLLSDELLQPSGAKLQFKRCIVVHHSG